MKGQQETKEDVITLAANLQLFARFWIKVNENIYEQEPLVVTMAGEVADFVSSPNFANFYNKHKSTTKYLARMIIIYMFNIFSLFVSTAKITKWLHLWYRSCLTNYVYAQSRDLCILYSHNHPRPFPPFVHIL